jgi:SsrA-binding protein
MSTNSSLLYFTFPFRYDVSMKIINKRAGFEYEIIEKFEAGINLFGSEVKAIRLGHADLSGSHVRINGMEAYLINAKIFPYKYARPENYDETRTRKLLLHRKEILALKHKMDGAGLTIVPLSLYTTTRLIKLEVALAKGKKQFEKKAAIKKRDLNRDLEQNFSNQ